jgi:hypothetical protein
VEFKGKECISFHSSPVPSFKPEEATMSIKSWVRPVLWGLFISAILSSAPWADAEETINPHNTRITDCTDCHTEDIYTEDCHERDGFCLMAKSVDDLCLYCHVKAECCRLGQEHQTMLFLGENSHPSNVDVRDVNPAHLPKTLPIHDGRITCRTCHLHSRAEDSDYKMLRLVELDGNRVDWTVLCADCHEKYS